MFKQGVDSLNPESRGMRLDDFSYNALIGSFSRAGEWQYALHFLSLKAASKYQLDVHACSACVSDSWRCSFFSMAPTFSKPDLACEALAVLICPLFTGFNLHLAGHTGVHSFP